MDKNAQLILPFIGITKFFSLLSNKEKKIYEVYFKNPYMTVEALAQAAECSKSLVDRFKAKEGLKEEVGELFKERFNSGEMLEVLDAAFKTAKTSGGHRDRKLLLEGAGVLGTRTEGSVPENINVQIIGKVGE